MTAPDLSSLSRAIGHRFRDPALLERALAHRSWCAEHPGALSNERLEFLGDAVLGWVVADLAYRRYADLPEGSLTGVRKGVVNAAALADAARQIGLGQHLRLGRGEAADGGRDKPSILSDAFEAVIAALYLDGGAAVASAFVDRLVGPKMDAITEQLDHLDHKSRLQELAVRAGRDVPVYESRAEGPDHAKEFFAVAVVGGARLGEGRGPSKKIAEQAAAALAADALEAQLANG